MPKTKEEIAEEIDTWVDNMDLVVLTPAEFDRLLEYSTTLPTGKAIGKQWKRQLYHGKHRLSWVLGEYAEDPDPAFVGIIWKLIAIKEKT